MKKILVAIDDSLVNREIFKEAARQLDMDLICAENGQVGYDKVCSSIIDGNTPNMVITDIHMPVMNGVEFIKKLKTGYNTRYIPIVVLTTEKDEETKTQCKNLGATGWINKPLTPGQIVAVVKKFVK